MIAIFLVLIAMLSSVVFVISTDAAINISNLRKNLWTKGGTVTASNSDILTVNALNHYAMNGVWGTDCMLEVKSSTPDNLTEFFSLNKCEKAEEFYKAAEKYGTIVDNRMSLADPTGQRVDKAMTRFSLLANEVFAILIGFGLLTSLLVFIIMFMRISWMPSHAIDRRRMIIDVATAGGATMLLGNVWVVVSLFQSCFNRFWQTFAVYSKDWRTVANMVLVEYKGFIIGLSGIATLFVLAMFVVNFIGLALDGGAANKRSEKIQKILQCSIAAAGLGSVTIIVGFFWNLFV
jgi:hypothetical protein